MSLPKKLLLVSLAVLTVAYIVWVVVYNVNLTPAANGQSQGVSYGSPSHPVVSELFADVNAERVKYGLPELVDDPRLDASAAAKCADMRDLDYWSHNRPDGTEPWHFITEQGIPYYSLKAENQAYGWPNSQSVVGAWMNSPGHKANIINPDYREVGYAVCRSTNFVGTGVEDIVVQHFTN